jgi:hypothetical protein
MGTETPKKLQVILVIEDVAKQLQLKKYIPFNSFKN